jgi:serine/threonine protein kinase
LKGNKAGKVDYVGAWEYKQRNEMKSLIASEFAISKKAEHLGIGPKTYDAFICHNTKELMAYKVMVSDYVKGVSLEQWLKQKHSPLERRRVYDLVKKKIDIMHTNGIIHTNLYSSNIILKTGKGGQIEDALITDFNSSYDVQDKTLWDYNKWIRDDRRVLDAIRNEAYSYNNADDVVNYVTFLMLKNKDIVIS